MIRRWMALAGVLFLLTGLGTASASNVLQAQSEALDLEGLEESARDYIGDLSLEDGVSLEEGLSYILDTGSGQVFGVLRKALRSGVLLVVVVVLCGLAGGLYSGAGGGPAADAAALAGALAVTAV